MDDLNDKLTGGNLTASEWNQPMSEIQSVIEGLGQALSGGDLTQLGKGIAGYVASGQFYTDSGTANAKVLTTIGAKQSATGYADGFTAVFRNGTLNTGATTVNVSGLGVVNIFFDGAALVGGEMPAGSLCTVHYDNANGRVDLIPELSQLYSNGSVIGIGAVPDLGVGLHIKISDSGGTVFSGADALALESNGSTGLTILSGTGSSGNIYFGDSDSNSSGVITYSHGDDRFDFHAVDINVMSLRNGLYMDGATGGDLGADTINASGIFVDGIELTIGTLVSGYDRRQITQIESDIGVDTNSFDIDAVISAAWESVGPTGSGATNIWTALNNVPSAASVVILKLRNEVTGVTNTTTYKSQINARSTGSSATVGDSTVVSSTEFVNTSGGSEKTGTFDTIFIPIDSSRRFDMYMSLTGSPTVNIAVAYLVGWLE